MNLNSRKLCPLLTAWLILRISCAQIPAVSEETVPTFGVTVVAPFGFCGRIYELPESRLPTGVIPPIGLERPRAESNRGTLPPPIGLPVVCTTTLPKFERLQPVGNIYTTKLSIPPRDFKMGFPGVSGRFEWFAIDYTARFWIEKPGKYSFALMSDDGSALYIDERRIINNDCMHPPLTERGSVRIESGIHDIRVSYFQGPRWQVALVLSVKPPGEQWRVFDTDEFKPPVHPGRNRPTPANLDAPWDPCKIEHRRELITRP